ncbi:MAG TPA: M14 family zinc carboxypeptidase [Gemmatimonadaceae bacterium]|nr:M14 family zinc carboxypeptidase [Gemmatimonadaceae bacterium]
MRQPDRRLRATLAAAAALLASCMPHRPQPLPAAASDHGGLAPLLAVAARYRTPGLETRRFTQAELWRAVEPALASPALRAEEVGRSLQGRPIRAVTFGGGPTTVLLWSQMHGDEPTATMALADVLAYFAGRGDADAQPRERIAAALTVVMVPMLNPDGAELHQRENAAGVDINRDARRLATPEARALKALRERLRPAFGFNLHDQGARTLAGPGGQQVAVALLAPPTDAGGAYDETRQRARLVAAHVARVLAPELRGRVAKYEDDFNPRAFGDLMQHWGTSTVLIESGALTGDPEKQRLRALNAAAILSALDAIATGAYREEASAPYDDLPFNARIPYDLVVRGATLVIGGDSTPPVPLDLALSYDDAVARTGPRLREAGDLSDVAALDTLDAAGLFIHPDPAMTARGATGFPALRIGAPVALTLRRGREPRSEVVRRIDGGGGGGR